MDGAADDYNREAYTRRYKERLRHQKEKQLESTKVWVLSLPQHRLDLRCHSIASVKVDEFFHSTLYFQWCVRRFKKSLGGSLPEDQDGADWATMIFEYMMAASERKPFETYNLTDQQILTDAKEVFGVFDDSLAFPVMKPNGMLEFGMVTHNPKEKLEAGRSGNAMSCWAHRINRDQDTIFETCRNEGLQFHSMLKGVMKMNNQPVEEGMLTDESKSNPPPPTTDDSTPAAIAAVPLATTASVSEEKPMLEPESELTSSTKNSDILKQIGEIIAGKVSEEGKEDIGGVTPSTSEAASASALNDTGGGGGTTGMSYKDACSEISAAIDFGAPAYNKGDHKGCYERYREAGEKILEKCSLKGVRQELCSAVELADKQPSFTKQAWTMRHAFDAILCGDIDTSDFTDSDKEELAKSTGANDEPAEMGYKEACLEISAAISQGAPTYNEGDHSGCYNIYRQAAEKIVEHCSVAVVQQKLRLALYLAEKQPSFTDRAWTMRHSFDAILRGIFVILNGSVGNDEEGEGAANGEGADEEEKGMSYEEACEEISAAISRGAPLYNEGDHEGCFNTYKQAAEKILEECTVAGVKREIRSALETVSKQASATMRAWTLRHAFDAILRGNIDRERGGSVRVRRGDGANVSFSELLERRGTL